MSDIIEVIKDVTTVTIASDGPQGPAGPTGPTGPEGAAGPTGSSGVISVVAPITNTGTSTSAIIGINAGVAGGVATLDGTGKVPQNQLPAVAITNTFVVNSQAAMLALTAEEGDVAVRTDLNKSFILTATPSSTLANWQELLTPTDSVLSVDGLTGAVNLTTKYAQLATANTFTGGVQQITTASAATIGLIVKATASQSANLQEWQDSSANPFLRVNSIGSLLFGPTTAGSFLSGGNGRVFVLTNNAAIVPVTVQGFASQTANLQEWQNSAGTVLARVSSSGLFSSAVGYTNGANTGAYIETGSNTLVLLQRIAGTVGVVVKGAASQTANLQEWQDSSGNILAQISSAGAMTFRANDGANNHRTIITTNTSGVIFNSTRSAGAASNFIIQTANVERFIVTENGTAQFTNVAAAAVAVVIQGAASQTADLQQWRSSTPTTLTAITSAGTINFASGNTSATANTGAVALPALAVGFITMQVAGTTVKVPYYAN